MRTYRFYKKVCPIEGTGYWFIDLKYFPFNKAWLAMVLGADLLLDKLSNNKNEVLLGVSSKRPKNNNYDDCIIKKQDLGLLKGAVYKTVINKIPSSGFGKNKLWLCAVTLWVFWKYPKKIYFKIK